MTNFPATVTPQTVYTATYPGIRLFAARFDDSSGAAPVFELNGGNVGFNQVGQNTSAAQALFTVLLATNETIEHSGKAIELSVVRVGDEL